MVACSEWTGVPLSTLLDEAGVDAGANWVFAEGAESIRLGASLPMGKAMDDVIVAYGQNGEPIRPHQGYPLRLVVPGFQGKYHVKWLRRLRLVERPLMSYWEKHHFLDRGYRPGGEARTSDFGGDFYLGAGTEVGHHHPVRRTAAARCRLLHDHRPRMVRVRRCTQGGSLHRRRSELERRRD